jgi:hypothetical protein
VDVKVIIASVVGGGIAGAVILYVVMNYIVGSTTALQDHRE